MSFLGSKFNSAFSPQNIPGLVVWLDAADSRTITLTGSNVSRWNDKVTNGTQYAASNIFTGPTLGTINGVQALRYTSSSGSGMMFFGSSYTPKTTGFSYFITFSPTSLTTGGARLFHAYVSTDRLFGINSNSVTVYTGTATATSQTTPVFDNLTIMTAYEDTSNISIILNGSLTTSAPTPAATAASTMTNASIGTGYTGVDRMDGFMCEILLFNRNLPLAERQLVEGYLRRKWSRTFSDNHPYATIPPILRPFNPLDISGCALWLDAADYQTFTLSSNSVTQWNDKSGNARNATTFSASPTYSSISQAVSFSGTQGLGTSLTAEPPAESGFFVVTPTNVSAVNTLVGHGNQDTGRQFRIYLGKQELMRQSAAVVLTGSLTLANNTRYICEYVNSGTRITQYLRGAYDASGTGYSWTPSTSTTSIGYRFGPSEGFVGTMNEIVMYDRAVSDIERQQVELYLGEKWGLRSDLSTANPLRLFRSLSPVFNPNVLSNCVLWLDAADSTTVTLSASTTITQWRDKSGTGYTGTFTAGRNFTYASNIRNGLNCVQTATGQTMIISSFALGPSMSVFKLYYPINTAAGSPFVEHGADTNSFSGFFFHAQTNAQFSVRNTSGQSSVSVPTTAISNTWQLLQGINRDPDSASNLTFYVNGVRQTAGSTGVTGSNISSNLFINGRNNTNTLSYPAYLAEIIIYSRGLPVAERMIVESYLMSKWNLPTLLSSSNVYKSTPV